MPVFKRKYPSGRTTWSYQFDAPGSTRQKRNVAKESGFATRKDAQEAEAARRVQIQRQHEAQRAGRLVEETPGTLGGLLAEFFRIRGPELAPKTLERYKEGAAYLSPALLAMAQQEIKPWQFSLEWERLVREGGRTRQGAPRAMSPKTVRNIAGIVSAAFNRAVELELLTTNPVTNSKPPRVRKARAVALPTAQQDTLLEAASGPWCIRPLLELDAATGARRGEVLALRWSDIVGGCAVITRSLTQTFRLVDGKRVHDVLGFKDTKTGKPRVVALPESVLTTLEEHGKRQQIFREQYGPDYRADVDLIFANPDGTPLRPDSVSATVSALFKRLKIPKPKGAALHLLRHSHTSVLLAAGVPVPAVSARLGHSSVRTTQEIYAHMIAGQDEEAAKKWEEYQRRNRALAGDPAGKVQ